VRVGQHPGLCVCLFTCWCVSVSVSVCVCVCERESVCVLGLGCQCTHRRAVCTDVLKGQVGQEGELWMKTEFHLPRMVTE